MLALFFVTSLLTIAAPINNTVGVAEDATSSSATLTSVLSLVWSCLTVIFASTWLAIHPNVPGPRDTDWTIRLRKVKIFVISVIAPEWMLLWASKQWFAAQRYRYLYNKFQKTERQNVTDPWTLTHGYFMVMGGFILDHDECPAFPVVFENGMEPKDFDFKTFPALEKLESGSHRGTISMLSRSISKDEIEDQSKRDVVAKALVVSQITWFFIRFYTKLYEGYPVTQLEYTTFAYAIVSVMVYVIWWYKPKDVRYPVGVRLSSNADLERYKKIQESGDHSVSDTGILDKLINVLLIIFISGKVYPDIRKTHQMIPEFFSGNSIDRNYFKCVGFATFLGIIFGLYLGLLVYPTSLLQTGTERRMWFISAVVVTVVPGTLAFTLIILPLKRHLKKRLDPVPRDPILPALFEMGHAIFDSLVTIFIAIGNAIFVSFVTISIAIGVPAYILARLALIVITFTSLRILPPKALYVVEWTSYFPHIG